MYRNMQLCARFSGVLTRAVVHKRTFPVFSTSACFQWPKKDDLPPQPKRPPSSFISFALDQKAAIPSLKDKSICQISSTLRDKWKELSDEERQAYGARSKEKLHEYRKKLAEYNLSLGFPENRVVPSHKNQLLPRSKARRKLRVLVKKLGGPRLQKSSPFTLYIQELSKEYLQAVDTGVDLGAIVKDQNLTAGQSPTPGGKAERDGTEIPPTVTPSTVSQSDVPDYVKACPQLAIGNRILKTASATWRSMSQQERDIYRKKWEKLREISQKQTIEWWASLSQDKRDLIADKYGEFQVWRKPAQARNLLNRLVEELGEDHGRLAFDIVKGQERDKNFVEKLPWIFVWKWEKLNAEKKRKISRKCEEELSTKT